MAFQVGDRVVAESESTERPPRAGTVLETRRRGTGSSGTTATRRATRRPPAPYALPASPPAQRPDEGGRVARACERRGLRPGSPVAHVSE
jgi:hypothetical protein